MPEGTAQCFLSGKYCAQGGQLLEDHGKHRDYKAGRAAHRSGHRAGPQMPYCVQ